MSLSQKIKEKYNANFDVPTEYYAQAEQEINNGTIDQGLWAKALVNAKGNEAIRKAEYIKLRARQFNKKIKSKDDAIKYKLNDLSWFNDLSLFVDNKLIFENPQTGRIKKIKVGFSFPSFFFDWIALFVKGLFGFGSIVLAINIALNIVSAVRIHYQGQIDTSMLMLVLLTCFGVKICCGLRANQWHARALLAKGWLLQNGNAATPTLVSAGWKLDLSPTNGENPGLGDTQAMKHGQNKGWILTPNPKYAQWFFIENGIRKGPVSSKEIQDLFLGKKLEVSSRIWRKNSDEPVWLADTDLIQLIQ